MREIVRDCSRFSLPWNSFFYLMAFVSWQDSVYNLDPEKPEMMDDFTAAMLEKEGKEFSDLETEIVEAPFVQVPASAEEPRRRPF